MFVYVLHSINFQNQVYTGIADDVDKRLIDHNSGKSPHTRKYKPWMIQAKIWFKDEKLAVRFEQYLKTGSGIAFRRKHFE